MTAEGSIKLGQVKGVAVALHPINLLYLLLGVLLLALGPLGTMAADRPVTTWLLAGAVVGLMGVSVGLHELGHLLAAAYYQLPLRQTSLYPFGGVAQMGSTPIPFLPYFFMILAGPLASLAQAAIWLGLWLATDMAFCLWLAEFNGALALLNLLPVARLDGGNLLILLGQSFLGTASVTWIGFLTSVYFPMGFTLAGGTVLLYGFLLPDLMWVLAGFVLLLTSLLFQVEPDYVMLSCTQAQLNDLERISAGTVYAPLAGQAPLEMVEVTGRFPQPEAIANLAFSNDTRGPAPADGRSQPLATLQPLLVSPKTSLLQALYKLDSLRASTLLLVEDNQIIGKITHDQILQYLTGQEKGASLKSTNLFMLLKANTAAVNRLHIS